MKKTITYLLLLIVAITITGCQKSENSNLEVKYQDYLDEVIGSNYTYSFIWQSEHFYFETGNVYYGDNYSDNKRGFAYLFNNGNLDNNYNDIKNKIASLLNNRRVRCVF